MQFEKIAAAIDIYSSAQGHNLSVDEVAERVSMSASSFSRNFRAGVGLSPDKFSNYLKAIRIEARLQQAPQAVLGSISTALGLKSASSIYDHSYKILALSPSQIADGGASLRLSYGSAYTPFGQAHIFTSSHGICRLTFNDDLKAELSFMRQRLPGAAMQPDNASAQTWAQKLFAAQEQRIPLHLLGTNFQISVWQALLAINSGSVSCYQQLAEFIGKPAAARAVGNAVGANPIAWLIPCHRVLRANGAIGGYRWGSARKEAMLALELATAS